MECFEGRSADRSEKDNHAHCSQKERQEPVKTTAFWKTCYI